MPTNPSTGRLAGPAKPIPFRLPLTGTMVWARTFPGRLDQAAQARRFARFLLAETPWADDAELIVSELAGNALRHTRSGGAGGRFAVEVALGRASPGRVADGVVVTVQDNGGGGVPRLGGDGPPDTESEHGRGLAIIATVATRLGYQGNPETGHSVWAYLAPERTGSR
ncbi:ATP-binding protein [Sphaerisporangium aureirubrum]|uniref:ATP-binding protein n=1 Tax=Sphaerisporangium aureirubrum TaxID=1544736 RepID=A0ABW1NSX6_9ACTN